MATYKTPDVYVEEISIFPPSVAEVETAVPAFIGYTEKAEKYGEDLTNKPTKIKSMTEFKEYFGEGPSMSPTVKLDENNNITSVTLGANQFYMYDSIRLFYDNGGGKCYIISVGQYKNTSKPIIGNASSGTGLLGGLAALEKEDEPTIIVAPDATLCANSTDLYDFQKQALLQASKLQDRVVICDLQNTSTNSQNNHDTDKNAFRNNIGINNLKYGAAYTPWLKVSYNKNIKYRDLTLQRTNSTTALKLEDLTKDTALKSFITNELKASIKAIDGDASATTPTKGISHIISDNITGDNKTLKEQFSFLVDEYEDAKDFASGDEAQVVLTPVYDLLKTILHRMIYDVRGVLTDTTDFKLKADLDTIVKNNKLDTVVGKLLYYHNANSQYNFSTGKIFTTGTGSNDDLKQVLDTINAICNSSLSKTTSDSTVNTSVTNAADMNAKADLAIAEAKSTFAVINTAVNDLKATAEAYEKTFDDSLKEKFGLYKTIITKVNEGANILPPSGAVAGIYAMVDATRGVWKAPANVSLNMVNGPYVKIDSNDQADLNVDVNAGKSINAIRAFTGKGTLIWGARTLAGNDNEWRYISVRRFYNMVEESVKKSTYWAVFEPNDANTWIKVKAMIENYLTQKWRDGALAGAKPDDAFFVKVGLGITMTAQDILEGRMNVEIGMAVVRPAEFIILKFSHKMQES